MKKHKLKSSINSTGDVQINKHWKKGQSCVSNPICNKFRQQAKKNRNGVYMPDNKPSGLTIEALHKHEAINIDRDFVIESDASTYITGITAASYTSVCTNASFSKIINRFAMSNSASHKEVLVILEAIAELIKENEEVDTETDYFAALLLLLKNENIENDTQLNSVLFLLSIVIKRVPAAVLKSKFSETSKIISDVFNEKLNSDSQSLIRSVLIILAHLLKCQDYLSWSHESTKHIFYSILCLVDSPKPKIRKAAHRAVGIVLRGSIFMLSNKAPSHHPAANQTAKYCVKKLEKHSSSTFFILGLLSDVMAVFMSSDLKLTCETILKLMTLSDSMTKTVCMTTMRRMFGMRPNVNVLSSELNAQIISALFEYRPSDEDHQMAEQWMLLMHKAYSNLSRLDGNLFLSHLPRLFETLFKYLQHNSRNAPTLTTVIKDILNDCNTETIKNLAASLSLNNDSPMHKLIRKFEHSFGYQFVSVWDTVLIVYTHFIEVFGKSCSLLFNQSLKLIDTLRSTPNFPHVALIDKAVGATVTNIGPKQLLIALPLNIAGNNEDDLSLNRSWLLPIISKNVRQTELSFYIEYFLPLALNIKRKCDSLVSSPQQIQYKTYLALQNQIWSLLPGFCTEPTDLKESFPKIAQLLGKLIQTNNDVRSDILNSIRKLINLHLEKNNEKEVLARFAKNFIPIFCNLYTLTKIEEDVSMDVEMKKALKNESRSLPKSGCLAILETFKCYLKISDKTVIETCIQTCLKKLFCDDVSNLQKYLLLDLVICMLHYISFEHLHTIYTFALKNLEVSDKSIQKKSYRIMEEICKSQSDEMKQLMVSVTDDIISKFTTTLISSNPSSKRPCLKCLFNIMEHNQQLDEKLFSTILPEVVMCTKAIGERTRSAAYNLLIGMARAYMRCNPQLDKQESLMKFVIMLLPGLALSNVSMVACTILSITKVIFDLKECVNEEMLKMLVESICILLKSRSREIVQTALSFIKCLIVSFLSIFDKFLKPVLTSLVCMKDENRHHFRFKTKEIYIRLIRKYGHKLLIEMLPESQHKWISHIRKEIDRNKKKKAFKKLQNGEDNDNEHLSDNKSYKTADNEISDLLEDTDSEEMENEEEEIVSIHSSRISKNKKMKTMTTYLREDNEDPIDFLDPTASQKILVSKPKTIEKSKSSAINDFQIASDGRILIPSENDEKKNTKKKKVPTATLR